MESTGARLKSTVMGIMLVFNGATVAQDVIEVMTRTHVHALEYMGTYIIFYISIFLIQVSFPFFYFYSI